MTDASFPVSGWIGSRTSSIDHAATRVRRYLSRYLVVVVVALAFEGLVATFKALHENPELLPHAATILVSVGCLLAGWGAFIWFNRVAESLEPEAMALAKREGQKLSEPAAS